MPAHVTPNERGRPPPGAPSPTHGFTTGIGMPTALSRNADAD
ncbi:hypothetical protein [Streptomyces hypolithicus]